MSKEEADLGPVPKEPTGQLGAWSGEVDTTHKDRRWRGRRIRYEDLANECAGFNLYGAPRRNGGLRFWVVPASRAKPRSAPLYYPWAEGVVELRRQFVTVSIDPNGCCHVVWASGEAARAAKAVMAELRRLNRIQERYER
ncbi:MAG: hypothetical protein ABSA63_02930 [Thermoplasmata archaeon]